MTDANKKRDPVREQFEAWFRAEYQLGADDEINFANGEVRMMLKGWQASRQAVVVDLPDAEGLNREHMLVQGFLEGVAHTRAAIEALGLRVGVRK